MTDQDVEESKEAMRKVEKKYGKSSGQAKIFLKKMGYLTKSGKVSSAYAEPGKKVRAAR